MGTQIIECHPNIVSYQVDPISELLKPDGIWLGSCAGMYKAESIGLDYFEDYAAYGEWTYLAFKLAVYNKIRFIEHKGFKINMHNESLSHSPAYLIGLYRMHQKVMSLSLSKSARRLFKVKIGAMEHNIASKHLENGEIKEAWHYHLKSLKSFHGLLSYLFYTRFFLELYFKR